MWAAHGKKCPRLWAVNWLIPKQCPPGVPREMKSPGSSYHLQDGVKTGQTQATRIRKLIWNTAMVLGSQDGDLTLGEKNVKEAFTPERRVRSWTNEMSCIKWNAHLMARQNQNIYAPAARHNSGTTSNYHSAYICSALIYWSKGGKNFCGEREVIFKYKTQKRAYVIMDSSNSPKVNTQTCFQHLKQEHHKPLRLSTSLSMQS